MQDGQARTFKAMLIDLDDCLYRVDAIADLVRTKIYAYMTEKLHIKRNLVNTVLKEYYHSFGTTMAGLVANGYKIDANDWHKSVHGTLPYEQLLKPDNELRHMLQSIPLPKYVFTNADKAHADICLRLLGLQDCFEGVICFETIMEAAARKAGRTNTEPQPIVCKPQHKAFELALEMAGAEPESTIFFDDSMRNVAAGRKCGIYTVLVGRTGAHSDADMEIASMHDLPTALPQLWTDSSSQEPWRQRSPPAEAERLVCQA